jgi:hypothetical protein
MRRKFIPVITVLSASILLTGCAGASVPTPDSSGATSSPMPPSPVTPAVSTSLADSIELQRQDEEELLRSRVPDVDVPYVQTVRAVAFEELAEVRAACLSQQGWAVSVAEDGRGIEYTLQPSQESAYALAEYHCNVEYPLLADYVMSENLDALYTYYVEELIACVEAAGQSIPAPPSRQAFVGGEAWSPYDFVNLADAQRAALETACPQHP